MLGDLSSLLCLAHTRTSQGRAGLGRGQGQASTESKARASMGPRAGGPLPCSRLPRQSEMVSCSDRKSPLPVLSPPCPCPGRVSVPPGQEAAPSWSAVPPVVKILGKGEPMLAATGCRVSQTGPGSYPVPHPSRSRPAHTMEPLWPSSPGSISWTTSVSFAVSWASHRAAR